MRQFILLIIVLGIVGCFPKSFTQELSQSLEVSYHDELAVLAPHEKTQIETRVQLQQGILTVKTPGHRAWSLQLDQGKQVPKFGKLKVYVLKSGLMFQFVINDEGHKSYVFYDLKGKKHWQTAGFKSSVFKVSPDESLMVLVSMREQNNKLVYERQLWDMSAGQLIKLIDSIEIDPLEMFEERGNLKRLKKINFFNHSWYQNSEFFVMGSLDTTGNHCGVYDRRGKMIRSFRFKYARPMRFVGGFGNKIFATELVVLPLTSKNKAILSFDPDEPEKQTWKFYEDNWLICYLTRNSLSVASLHVQDAKLIKQTKKLELLDEDLSPMWSATGENLQLKAGETPRLLRSPDAAELWMLTHQFRQPFKRITQLNKKGQKLQQFLLPVEIQIYWNPRLEQFTYELEGLTYLLNTQKPLKAR